VTYEHGCLDCNLVIRKHYDQLSFMVVLECAMHWWWSQELSKRLQNVVHIVFIGGYFHCKAIQHFRLLCTKVLALLFMCSSQEHFSARDHLEMYKVDDEGTTITPLLQMSRTPNVCVRGQWVLTIRRFPWCHQMSL